MEVVPVAALIAAVACGNPHQRCFKGPSNIRSQILFMCLWCVQDTAYLSAGASLDLQQLLPANQSYVSYAGSLTTPPCTEGLLWIMMLNTQKMSLQQVRCTG